LVVIASVSLFALASCGEDRPDGAEQCAAGQTACGDACCGAGEHCDAQTSTCKPSQCEAGQTACGDACCGDSEYCDAQTSTCKPRPAGLESCYTRASLLSNAFSTQPSYNVDDDGWEYLALHTADSPYQQMLSVALWPLSSSTKLTGTFDLSKEPFSYATCERCVLVIARTLNGSEKYYLARQGFLTVNEVGTTRISGSLSNVKLVEVEIDDESLETEEVEGGCALEIPGLTFEYSRFGPIDERIEQCLLPESFTSDQFRDFIYPLEANDAGYFYRAIELPAVSGYPNLTLFVEVYRDGVGTFSLEGAEVNCETCYHHVIIEARGVSGAQKDYVSASGRLVLTELSEEAMVGRLENVTLVETVIQKSVFTPVPGGCTTYIESLSFDSRDETKL
jgi:hypothetical protein